MKKITISILLLSIIGLLQAQIAATNSGGEVVQVQPKVIVIPRVNEGQDIRTILDQNEYLRACITNMSEKFTQRGFRTDNFVARLKMALSNKVFTSENQTDMKTMILQMSDPDIYVELDVNEVTCSGGHIARVNMNAYYTGTGVSVSEKVASSYCMSVELGRLALKAIDENSEVFLNAMQTNFDEFKLNGVPVFISFGFSQNSSLSMSSEIASMENKELSEVIEDWMENAAYKNQYGSPLVTDKTMILNEVRLPLKNQENKKNYTLSKFAAEITSFLKGIGVSCKKDMKTGGVIITIQ